MPKQCTLARSKTTPTLFTAMSLGISLGASLSLAGCNKRKFNSITKSSSAEQTEHKACVGTQGNGVRFPSHIGTFTALLESNITPVVTMGGSSGSIIGSVVMGLLENTSYNDHTVRAGGRTLTRAQKAALILAATPDVVNSYIFLPALNSLWQTVMDVSTFVLGMGYGKALLGDSDMRIVSTEAIVGQSALMVDFFTHQDFSSVLHLKTFAERRSEVFRLWKEFSNAETVTVRQLINAAKGKLSKEEEDRFDNLDKRLYAFFQRDVAERDETITFSWKVALKAMDAALRAADKTALPQKLDEIVLTIPDPKLLWNSYSSRTKDGKFMPVPKGMIIHSTFRRGVFELKDIVIKNNRGDSVVPETHTRIEFAEAVGLDKLFQGYTANDHPAMPLYSQLRDARREQEAAGKGFQPYLNEDKSISYAYPVQQILVLPTVHDNEAGQFVAVKLPNEGQRLVKDGLRGLAHGIAYSAGEPGPFSRTMLTISTQERKDNMANGKDVFEGIDSIKRSTKGEGIISFGGWSENVPLSTLAMLPACADAKFFVSGAKEGLGNQFQEAAVRGALKGWTSVTRKIRDAGAAFITGHPAAADDLVKKHFSAIDNSVLFSRAVIGERWFNNPTAKPQLLWNRLEFDAPSKASLQGDALKAVNGKLTNDRFALMIVSYQKMKEDISKIAGESFATSDLAFGRNILKKPTPESKNNEYLLEKMSTVEEINNFLQTIK